MLVRDLHGFSQMEKYYGGATNNSTLYQSVHLVPNTTTKKVLLHYLQLHYFTCTCWTRWYRET